MSVKLYTTHPSASVADSSSRVEENADHVFAVCSTTKTVSAHLSNWVKWWPTNVCSVIDLWEGIESTSSIGIERNITEDLLGLLSFGFVEPAEQHCEKGKGDSGRH
ncbi:hypothetical protein OSB04_008779 [Centaurea solstitialis]|uniref:Uncharacterized protein n=1 Tax=Centaurea solstitialis TaxID=347529 RepID=A0AA38TP62_9ASTR|nr:hypothetical protein OSB04_008779 [Centaurea solstitialis]